MDRKWDKQEGRKVETAEIRRCGVRGRKSWEHEGLGVPGQGCF